MNGKSTKLVGVLATLAVWLLTVAPLGAQSRGATLSGTVTGAGSAVAHAMVTVESLITGESKTTETDAAGRYTVPDLAPGKYRVSVSAAGFNKQTVTVTLSAGLTHTENFQLASALSLQSLGFSKSQTQSNSKEQALLNKRSHMLQIHQKLGLITAIPMIATLVAATQAGGRHGSPTGRDVHMALGAATAGLYWATAYYAIFAPRVPGVKTRGPIRFHEAMAWIHGPGMILTPILGILAEQQRNKGKRVHGMAKYHGLVAIITASAFGLALVSVSKPGWIPGLEHHVAALFPFHHRDILNAARRSQASKAGGATAEGRK
jgi:hypothetical protein